MAEAEAQKAKVTLHWLDQSRSQRIVWLLEECKGIDIDIKVYKRLPSMLAPPELKQIHPLGKSPVVTVETSAMPKPLVLAESGALVEYLSDHFAQHLVPKRWQEGKESQVGGETEEWLRYRYYMHYAEGSLMPPILIGVFADMIKNSPVPFFLKPITRSIGGRIDSAYLSDTFKTQFGFLESQLATSEGDFICGKNLTAADIMLSFPLSAVKPRLDRAQYPKLAAYTALLESQDGFLRSVKRIEEVSGEPFSPAKL